MKNYNVDFSYTEMKDKSDNSKPQVKPNFRQRFNANVKPVVTQVNRVAKPIRSGAGAVVKSFGGNVSKKPKHRQSGYLSDKPRLY